MLNDFYHYEIYLVRTILCSFNFVYIILKIPKLIIGETRVEKKKKIGGSAK